MNLHEEITPNHNPLGYYTLLVCALASTHYQIPDLAQRLFGEATNPVQVQEAHLTDLDCGEIDALFLYASAATQRVLPFITLPEEINLSNPALASTYAMVQYTTDTGKTFHGKPINFSAAVLNQATNEQASLQVVAFLLSEAGQHLVRDAHFLPGSALVRGDATTIPQSIQSLLQGVYQPFMGRSPGDCLEARTHRGSTSGTLASHRCPFAKEKVLV